MLNASATKLQIWNQTLCEIICSAAAVHMHDILDLITRHGYAVVALAVFLEAVGIPVPAALALFAAGVAGATHKLSLSVALPIAIVAMMLGDIPLFLLGRRTGWRLLGYLCRISANPESCILRSAESFYKRGRLTLVFAKFVPGISTMAAPLAGSMKMRPLQFLMYDLAGSCLYALVYVGMGFLFHNFLSVLVHGLETAGH